MKGTMEKQGEKFINSPKEVIIQPFGTLNLDKQINYKQLCMFTQNHMFPVMNSKSPLGRLAINH